MGVPVEEYTPSRGSDKIARLNSVADIFASGRVWVPNTNWAEELVEEVASFPGGEHDDLVDSMTQALLRFRRGGRMTVEVVKRVKEWFWVSDSGKINLAVKYGAKTLTLNKKTKANAIELANGDELVDTLKSLKLMVANGELDEAINEMSTATRLAFSK